MQRNTYLLLVGLAIFAALVIGVNIGRRSLMSQAVPEPTPTVSQAPRLVSYKNSACGVSFSYPENFILLDSASKSAILTSPEGGTEAIILTCQKNIPRPALSQDKTESMTIGSVSATLYHDSTPKDGQPIDILIFTNPKINEDVLLSGMGSGFDTALKSLELLP
jgi:hypothetical protein